MLRRDPVDMDSENWYLTERQIQILALTAQGLSGKEIARHLGGMSLRTIEHHRNHAVQKLGARNVAHATAMAVWLGIVKLDIVIPTEDYRPKRGGYPPRFALGEMDAAMKWLAAKRV